MSGFENKTSVGNMRIECGLKQKWIEQTWKQIIVAAPSFSILALARSLGDSPFIGCFTGGILYGSLHIKEKGKLLLAAERAANTLSLVTWFLFGSMKIPLLLSLVRSALPIKQQMFMGWFGPRGLASIVFAVIVPDVQ